MSVNLQDWCQFLTAVTPNAHLVDEHAWICEVQYNEIRRIEVLSERDYNNFFNTHSRWTSTCRKLSMQEITSLSQNLLSSSQDFSHFQLGRIKKTMRIAAISEIENFVHLTDVFSANVEEKMMAQLNRVKANAESLQIIPDALQKMSERARYKKTIEKSTGLWGTVKWYIWSWFYDKGGQVREIQRAVPVLSEVCRAARRAIQERIILNMESFEEEIHVSPDEHHLYSAEESFKKFDSSYKVEQLWLAKYGENVYSDPVSTVAQKCRRRIEVMLRMWENLTEFEANQAGTEE